MSDEWKRWCRLCSKQNGNQIDIFIKTENFYNLSNIIQKILSINITEYDEAPTKICLSCHEILTSLISFSIQSTKVQEMFSELTLCEKFDPITDLDSLREKYGLQYLPEMLKLNESEQIGTEKKTDCLITDIKSNDDDNDDEDDQPVATIKMRADRLKRKPKILSKKIDYLEKEEDECSDNLSDDNDIDFDPGTSKEPQESNEENDSSEDLLKLKIEVDSDVKEEKPKRKSSTKKQKRKQGQVANMHCEHCDRAFTTQSGLTLHLKNSHQIIRDRPKLPCSTCGKVYNSIAKLKDHENLHLPPETRRYYYCPQCNQKFNSRSSISVHVRTQHQKIKSFICEECGKPFYFRAQLNVHKITHSEECPFQCMKCPKKFKSAVLLKYHTDTHEDTKYICPVCGTVLNTKSILRRHMVIHSDVQKHKCNFCDKSFKRSKTLKDHLILHTGLKPYQCPFCDLTFANGSNSRKHQKQSHPIELAQMEERGEKKACKNIPKLETLKAANAAAMNALNTYNNSSSSSAIPLINSSIELPQTEERGQKKSCKNMLKSETFKAASAAAMNAINTYNSSSSTAANAAAMNALNAYTNSSSSGTANAVAMNATYNNSSSSKGIPINIPKIKIDEDL